MLCTGDGLLYPDLKRDFETLDLARIPRPQMLPGDFLVAQKWSVPSFADMSKQIHDRIANIHRWSRDMLQLWPKLSICPQAETTEPEIIRSRSQSSWELVMIIIIKNIWVSKLGQLAATRRRYRLLAREIHPDNVVEATKRSGCGDVWKGFGGFGLGSAESGPRFVIYGCFRKKGCPRMDGLQWKILLKFMIPYFRKHPYIYIYIGSVYI